jgi:heme-degrading monooxygenase HmoA
MIVALSRFTIANGMEGQVSEALREGPHRVDEASGFLGMEVMSPTDNSAEVWLFTRWRDEQCFLVKKIMQGCRI